MGSDGFREEEGACTFLQVSHLFLKKEKVGFTRDNYLGKGSQYKRIDW
jgi:hypothetical protein